MTISIKTNVAAMRAERLLAGQTAELSSVFERLSSGQRINRAADDAAGLAVATRLDASVRVLNAARRNINDGISMISIADSALDQQSRIVTRLTELASQSANGSYTQTQRNALDREYQELVREFGRLGDSSSFNSVALLRRGNGAGTVLQVGGDGTRNSTITLSSLESGSWSGVYRTMRGASGADYNRDGSTVTPDFADLDAFFNPQALGELSARFDDRLAMLSVTDSSGRSRRLALGFIWDPSGSFDVAAFLEDPTTGMFSVTDSNMGQTIFGVPGSQNIDPETGRLIGSGIVEIANGLGGSISLDLSGMRFSADAPESVLEFTGVRSGAGSLETLDILGSRLAEISLARGALGATLSRLDQAISAVQGRALQEQEAAARIRDADLAIEAARAVRLGILQSASAEVLSRVQQAPALALQLLS